MGSVALLSSPVEMANVDNRLLIRRLRAIRDQDCADESAWLAASEVFRSHAWKDADLDRALQERDSAHLGTRLQEWESGAQPYPAPDRAILKRALKAFRKRMKIEQLDEESNLGGGPFSGGRRSSLVAMQPPSQYPAEVWQELVQLGRLREVMQGFFELTDD